MELDAKEHRGLFDELKGKLVKHYEGKLDMSSAMETVLKIELYMNADFRGLWNLERKLRAKAEAKAAAELRAAAESKAISEFKAKAVAEDTGSSYFF